MNSGHPQRKKPELLPSSHLRLITDPKCEPKILKQRSRVERDRPILLKFVRHMMFVMLKHSGELSLTVIEKERNKENPFHLLKEKNERVTVRVPGELMLDPRLDPVPADYIREGYMVVIGGYWGGYITLSTFESRKPRVLRFSSAVVTALRVYERERLLLVGNREGVLVGYRYDKDLATKERFRVSLHAQVNSIQVEPASHCVVSATAEGKVFVHHLESQALLAFVAHPQRLGIQAAFLCTRPLHCLLFYSRQDSLLFSYSVNGQFLAKLEVEPMVDMLVGRDSYLADTAVLMLELRLLVLRTPFLELKKEITVNKKEASRLSCLSLSEDGRVLAMSNEVGTTIVALDPAAF